MCVSFDTGRMRIASRNSSHDVTLVKQVGQYLSISVGFSVVSLSVRTDRKTGLTEN